MLGCCCAARPLTVTLAAWWATSAALPAAPVATNTPPNTHACCEATLGSEADALAPSSLLLACRPQGRAAELPPVDLLNGCRLDLLTPLHCCSSCVAGRKGELQSRILLYLGELDPASSAVLGRSFSARAPQQQWKIEQAGALDGGAAAVDVEVELPCWWLCHRCCRQPAATATTSHSAAQPPSLCRACLLLPCCSPGGA